MSAYVIYYILPVSLDQSGHSPPTEKVAQPAGSPFTGCFSPLSASTQETV